MKPLIAGLALLLAAPFGAAMAADMPLKAPPVPLVVEYNWSGLYFGANAGWSWDHVDWQYTNPAPATCCAPFSARTDDGIAGVQSGIQYQWNHIVVGIEAAGDAFAREKWALGPTCIVPNSSTTGCQARHKGFLTAGGRLGWAWGDWLLYGSGGWAITDVQTRLVSLTTGFQFRSHRRPAPRRLVCWLRSRARGLQGRVGRPHCRGRISASRFRHRIGALFA
jgi:outer membrane immunogenic protein